MLVYRLTIQKYGKELQASGIEGRWNSRGEYVIYTASSRSLALLENLVHRGYSGMNAPFYLFTLELPENTAIQKISKDIFTDAIKNPDGIIISRKAGSDWLRQWKTVVLEVPASVVPEESNFVLNVSHPDFQKIKVVEVKPFEIERRLKMEVNS